jgi:hypothetical protein
MLGTSREYLNAILAKKSCDAARAEEIVLFNPCYEKNCAMRAIIPYAQITLLLF